MRRKKCIENYIDSILQDLKRHKDGSNKTEFSNFCFKRSHPYWRISHEEGDKIIIFNDFKMDVHQMFFGFPIIYYGRKWSMVNHLINNRIREFMKNDKG